MLVSSTQALMLAWQALYSTEPSLQPLFGFLILHGEGYLGVGMGWGERVENSRLGCTPCCAWMGCSRREALWVCSWCPCSVLSCAQPGMDDTHSSVSLSMVFLPFWSRVLSVSAVVSKGQSGSEQSLGAGVGQVASLPSLTVKTPLCTPSVTQDEAP